MSRRIEDYALIGDTQTAALVGRDGSIDWLCLPRFDSGACFAALLGGPEHGRWSLAPSGDARPAGRRYREDSLVLETDLASGGGAVRIVDAMPVRGERLDLVRRVEGLRGRVAMRSELAVRFDYGSILPWMRTHTGAGHGRGAGHRCSAVAGPDSIYVDADVDFTIGDDDVARAEFVVAEGQSVDFRLSWTESRNPPPDRADVCGEIERTERSWREWSRRCGYSGDYRPAVIRSLITLKALTYAPSGGIVAAPTTSLPERLGGVRNWDYRFCWIRDATFTLLALLDAGYEEEAKSWREWLLRALAGRPEQMQIMYGVEGERRLTEIELGLPGFAGSRPVRIGNGASEQFQLDVFGELMDALHQARAHGLPPDDNAWCLQRRLLDFLEGHWLDPDNGIWEFRGARRHFTHSKVMAWTAVDRAIRAVERFGLPGPADRWRRLRKEIFDEVCEKGYDACRRAFTQSYGSRDLDSALLLIPMVGFLPATDPRVTGTVQAIERELCHEGFVRRYGTGGEAHEIDGLPPGEGAFLPCTFWLADNYLMQGRTAEGRALFERLLGVANDVGLLSEEYDPVAGRLLGNFPQALAHIPLVDTALELGTDRAPGERRSLTGRRP